MSLQLNNKNLVLLVVGCSGSGKSTFAIQYLLNVKATCRFIFDPRGEYALRFNRRPCRVPAELHAAVSTGWVIFDPSTLFPGDPNTAVEKFCEWAWTVSEKLPGQKLMFVDEVWKHCSPNFIPKHLAMILMDGRKNGIGSVLTTHRPNKLNDAIAGEATELVSFSLTGALKLEWMKKNFDDFPNDEVKDLPPFHYIAQNLNTCGLIRGSLRK